MGKEQRERGGQRRVDVGVVVKSVGGKVGLGRRVELRRAVAVAVAVGVVVGAAAVKKV